MAILSNLGTGGHVLTTTDNRTPLAYLRAPKSTEWFEARTGVRGHSLNFDCSVGQKRSSALLHGRITDRAWPTSSGLSTASTFPADGPSLFLWIGAGMMEGGALFLPPS